MKLAAEVFAWRYGWLWPLAIAAAAALVAVVPGVMTPLQVRLNLARAERIEADAQLVDPGLHPPATDAWSSLEAILPPASGSDRHIQAIYDAAIRHGLQFTSSVLRTTDNPETGISRTEIALPVRGTYPRIAGFVETLLREQPNLSVDQLHFRRDDVAAREGEAEIRISSWTRSAPEDPAQREPAR